MRRATSQGVATLLFAFGVAGIAGAAELPAGAEALHAKLLGSASPAVRSWVAAEGRKLAGASRGAAADASVRAALNTRFAGQPLGAGDIEALTFIVLMQATRDMDQDLKMIMAEVKAMTAAKQKLRDLIGKVNQDVVQNAGKRDGDPCRPPQCGVGRAALAEVAPALARARARTDLGTRDIATIRDLRALQDELKGKLDSMNEMSEMTSLRLQTMMDRRSKLISTLSNVMKKVADTQSSIVQNLK